VPDWTYHPLRRPMGALLGERRSRLAALGVVAALSRLPGGRWVVALLGHTMPPREAAGQVSGVECAARVGATVEAEFAVAAASGLPALGAGLLEIGPFSLDSVERARRILESARAPIVLRVGGSDAAAVVREAGLRAVLVAVDLGDGTARLESHADGLSQEVGVVIRNATVSQVRGAVAGGRTIIATTSNASPAIAADLIDAGAAAVLITTAGLIEGGPGWFHRATMAYLARMPAYRAASQGAGRAWVAGLALGLGMIAGGVGAAVVALGPVVLPYDASFLGVGSAGLAAINSRLIQFLQHDRITLAGTMVAIGILYSALSWWGIRPGRTWARDALLASCVVGFPTLFYFFAYRYVEPIHVVMAAVLFPLFVFATWRRPRGHVLVDDEGPAGERQHALLGQLLMVTTGIGVVIGGLTISYAGLTTVFVPSDLAYMSTSAHALDAANQRLLSFIAHDRAGFGGALVSIGVAVALIAAWGWERGQAWVWWTLFASGAVGFGFALAVHIGVGYTDFWHVAPIYVGIAFTTVSLALGRRFLLAASPPARLRVPAPV
jgi:hypothetical protein